MRLIDADELMKECAIFVAPANNSDFAEVPTWNDAISLIGSAPTVDAVPVVRCKDCKYMTEHYDTDGNAPYWTCSEWDAGTDYDGFCHCGERKGDE